MAAAISLTEYDRGWLSCAVDTDGSISIHKTRAWRNKPEYNLRMNVTSASLELLARIQAICGENSGVIRLHHKAGTVSKQGQKAHVNSYRFWFSSKIFRELLPQLDLIVKERHKEIALRFLEITQCGLPVPSTSKRSLAVLDECECLYREMHELTSGDLYV